MSPTREGERGSTLLFTALVMMVILLASAIAIDVGVIGAARSQLQNAMDASALAGASGLFDDEAEATQRAITFAGLNECMNEAVIITGANVSFPEADQVRVEDTHEIDLYFARV
ncbi:MAG: pilus assembly protein TadG-related protein, partial [Candidatus Eisenbacteria bacterium]